MLIAITGGIGSGKSTCLNLFQELGASVADADLIVHQLYEDDQEMLDAIENRWGNKILNHDGHFDKKAIAKIVFFNDNERKWLNELIHPRVRREMDKLHDTSAITIIAIPLLYENGTENEYEKVISVWCDPTTQRKRLRDRSWSDDEINARINSQLCQDVKLERADYAIINNQNKKTLTLQCEKIYKQLTTEMRTTHE